MYNHPHRPHRRGWGNLPNYNFSVMPPTGSQSLRRLLFSHELAFFVLVAVAGGLGGVSAYFWHQTSAESLRLNGLAHSAQEIRSDLFRQVKEAMLAKLRDDPDAEAVYETYTKSIKARFNALRQNSRSRAEAYAVQALQEAYSTIQVDMNAIFDDPYVLNRMIRSRLLDPRYEQALVADFDSAFTNLRGLINQQLADQAEKVALWTRFAPFLIPVPILVAIMLLLISRSSVQRGFVRPVQSVVGALRSHDVAELAAIPDPGGVSEVGEITRGIRDMAGELERSRDALVDSERQAALGALVPVVAHNIRNPLASIRASAQLLEDDGADGEVRESREAIIETVDRLERWVSALVSYLHPLTPQTRQVSAAALFDATVRLLKPRLEEKRLTLTRAPWDPGVNVNVDPDLMEQALYALLTNAVEASPAGAEIALSIEGGAQVRLGIRDQAGGLAFKPEPTGLEPGPTTKKRGTGLGIPVAFKICKAHGWEIEFDSDPGVGTRVTLTARAPGALNDRES